MRDAARCPFSASGTARVWRRSRNLQLASLPRNVVVELRDQHAPLALNGEPASPRNRCFSTLPTCGVLLGQPVESETDARAGIKTQEDR